MKRRGLKRYYRNLRKANFIEEIMAGLKNGNAEYDYEHIHLDGYTLSKWKEIKLHLDVLFSRLDLFIFKFHRKIVEFFIGCMNI